MCYHDSKNYSTNDLVERYRVPVDDTDGESWEPFYHENGFSHNASPVLLPTKRFEFYQWGLVPWFMKPDGVAKIRKQTLNCISEEMYDKPSFRDPLKGGQRCLVPLTGFFEWKWSDAAGKDKTPYYIFLKDQPIFSVAGLYSSWQDKVTGRTLRTFTLLTTQANTLMAQIHNSKKRMPVILPKEYEKDWLNDGLSKDDVLAMCRPLDPALMDAYVVSKKLSGRKEPTNVADILKRVE